MGPNIPKRDTIASPQDKNDRVGHNCTVAPEIRSGNFNKIPVVKIPTSRVRIVHVAQESHRTRETGRESISWGNVFF